MNVSVRVEGLDRLEAKLAKLPRAVTDAAEAAVAEETEEVASDMRSNAPVATGELVDGILAEVDGLSGTAASTARHSQYVEFGTSSAPAQPFAVPAAEMSRGRFPRRMTDRVGDELGSL